MNRIGDHLLFYFLSITLKNKAMPNQARLFLRNKRYADGTFPAMNFMKKDLNRQGVPLMDMHVGYAVAKGTFYCGSCEAKVVNPPSDFYQKAEFWRCKCGKINYVKV